MDWEGFQWKGKGRKSMDMSMCMIHECMETSQCIPLICVTSMLVIIIKIVSNNS